MDGRAYFLDLYGLFLSYLFSLIRFPNKGIREAEPMREAQLEDPKDPSRMIFHTLGSAQLILSYLLYVLHLVCARIFLFTVELDYSIQFDEFHLSKQRLLPLRFG